MITDFYGQTVSNSPIPNVTDLSLLRNGSTMDSTMTTKGDVWENCIVAFVKSKERASRRPTYLQALRSYLGIASRAFAAMGCKTLADVKREHVERFFDDRKHSPATRRAGHARLSSWFTWGVKQRICETNIMTGIEYPIVEWATPRIFKPEEAAMILWTCSRARPDVVGFIALGLFAGIRPHELSQMSWSDLDLRPRDSWGDLKGYGVAKLQACHSKVRLRRVVPLHPTLLEWLATADRHQSGKLLRYTRPEGTLKLLSELSGVQWSQDVVRHTAASFMLALHEDPGRVSFWLGNSPTILLRHYHSLVDPDDSVRYWQLNPKRCDQLVRERSSQLNSPPVQAVAVDGENNGGQDTKRLAVSAT